MNNYSNTSNFKMKNPKSGVGKRFCRRLREVKAVQVLYDNFEELSAFTCGGILGINEETKDAEYGFINASGMNKYAVGGDWILFDGNEYSVMTDKHFREMYEPKDFEPITPEEMNKRYGSDILTRFEKLTEEYEELKEVVALEDCMTSEDFRERFLDELCDINAVVFHLASLFQKSQGDLLEMATDKIKGRDTDPNYKRIHPHKQ